VAKAKILGSSTDLILAFPIPLEMLEIITVFSHLLTEIFIRKKPWLSPFHYSTIPS
jgi:hypothetical protein